MIFDETTLRKLHRLTLVAQRVRAGVMKGERRSVKRGSSLEFADYRNYTPGDDLRRLDWKILGRLDRPFLKLFEEEEDLAVHVLLDVSQSMDWGEGEQNKLLYSIRLGAAVSSIALSSGDRLTAGILRQEAKEAGNQFGPSRGQGMVMPLLKFFEGVKPGGQTDLNYALRNYALAAQRPGLAFVISDLFSPSSFQDGLLQLQGRGYEVVMVHILSPEEIDPPLTGDLRLVDVETGVSQEVSVDGSMRRLYKERLEAWRDDIAATCHRRGVRYLPLSTAQPWDQVVFQQMRQTGVIK